MALRDHLPARPPLTPRYPVRVPRLARLLHASFRPRLAATPLRFANPSPIRLSRRLSLPTGRSCSAQKETPPCGGVQALLDGLGETLRGELLLGKVQGRFQEAVKQRQAGTKESESRLPIQ
jgi:hypothetical protein